MDWAARTARKGRLAQPAKTECWKVAIRDRSARTNGAWAKVIVGTKDGEKGGGTCWCHALATRLRQLAHMYSDLLYSFIIAISSTILA